MEGKNQGEIIEYKDPNTNKTIKASVKKYNENTGDYEVEFIDNDNCLAPPCTVNPLNLNIIKFAENKEFILNQFVYKEFEKNLDIILNILKM